MACHARLVQTHSAFTSESSWRQVVLIVSLEQAYDFCSVSDCGVTAKQSKSKAAQAHSSTQFNGSLALESVSCKISFLCVLQSPQASQSELFLTRFQYDFFKLKTLAAAPSAAGGSPFPDIWPKLCWSPRQWCRGGWYWGFELSGECSCKNLTLVSTGLTCRQALQQAMQPDGTYPNSSMSTCVE